MSQWEQAQLDAGGFVATKSKIDARTTEDVVARRYGGPALGQRVVVRLGADRLGPAEDLAMEHLGLEPRGASPPLGRQTRRALGFANWALTHHREHAKYALELVKRIKAAARLAKGKPGHAWDAFAAMAAELNKSVRHFLPAFWEEAARIYKDLGNPTYAGRALNKALEAERVHALDVDREHRRDAVLEFTLSGCLSGKALSEYAQDLQNQFEPAEAYATLRDLAVRRTLGGLAPMAELTRRVMGAGAAGVLVAPPTGLRTDDQIFDYFRGVVDVLGPDVPIIYQDYPPTTNVFLSSSLFLRMVPAFATMVMLKLEDCPGLDKLTRIRAGSEHDRLRRVSVLAGNGGLYFPQFLARGADGAMTGFAFPDMLVQVYERFAAGDRDGAEDLFDAYLPLVVYEQQPGYGLAVRKEILRRRGAIRCAAARAPGPRLRPADAAEIDYLCTMINRYFSRQITPADVVWSYSGVRPLFDDGADASSITRDYRLELDTEGAPLLSVWGGKLTTYRALAEEAIGMLARPMGIASGDWTTQAALPGGDLGSMIEASGDPMADFERFCALQQQRWPWLPAPLLRRYARAYGTRMERLLGQASSPGQLGEEIAAGLYAAEVEYLLAQEWAQTPDDILWRRSKLGLHLPADTGGKLGAWLARRTAPARSVAAA